MTFVRVLLFVVFWACTHPNATGQEIFWGKKVLGKTVKSKVVLGGDFQFRSMLYWMDCTDGCFENPWHIGELWSMSRFLGRGLSGPDSCCSLSPSNRFILFETTDTGAKKANLFDHNSGIQADVTDKIPGDPSIPESKWNEDVHELSVTYYKDRKLIASPLIIKLPE